jgi:hypothetical protein
MRGSSRPWFFAGAVLASVAFAAVARADVLTLHGGTVLEGRVVEQRATEVVFEHEIGGALTRSTFDKAVIDKIEITSGLGTRAAGAAAVTSARYPEATLYNHRVAIVLDRSGSMSIGDRWAQALDEVDAILASLPERTEFGLYVFDRKATSPFDGNFQKPTAATRVLVRTKLEALGVNLEGYTDIVAGLTPALGAHCEAVFLVTDGFPTQGEPSAAAVVRGVREQLKLLPPPKNVPLHVVQIEGGVYDLGDVENPEGARAILRALAAETGGTHHEVTAASRARTTFALKPLKELTPATDEVTFHIFEETLGPLPPTFAKEFFLREFVNIVFSVEVEDPALQRGPVILEYATQPTAPRIELQTFPLASVSPKLYDEKRTMRHLQVWNGGRKLGDLVNKQGAEDLNPFTTVGGRLGVLRCPQKINVVRTIDDQKSGLHNFDMSTENDAFIKLPLEGGTLEIVYKRGSREFRHVLFIDSPITGAGEAVAVTPGSPEATPLAPVKGKPQAPAPKPSSKNGNGSH